MDSPGVTHACPRPLPASGSRPRDPRPPSHPGRLWRRRRWILHAGFDPGGHPHLAAEGSGVVSVTEKASSISGTRFFVLGLTQAENHFATPTPTFTQVVTVLFRSRTAPTTLATTGYSISQNPSEWEPTRILGANQVTMEHRFFNTSTPADLDWTKLTIQQAAADEHQVVLALKPILTGKWLNTGGSKGGMTALFHRRFYPGDVDATVAYVAPISLTSPDNRYIAFVTSRGTTANQQAIHAWQQAIFDNRAAVLALFEADAANQGETLNDLGADKALEFAVLESPSSFGSTAMPPWPTKCPALAPRPSSSMTIWT